MNVVNWPIDRPIPYGRNARKIPQAAIDKVAASIAEFGFRQPIVVDAQGVLVVGHTRLLAAKKLGLSEVPVHVAENLTPEQIKTYRLMDNRSHQEATWDLELLVPEISELEALAVDLALTGFDRHEIDGFLAKADASDGLTEADDCPASPEVPIAEPGDLWILGRHRLLCGDATVSTHIDMLMAGAKADLVVTDPPYNVAYTGKTKDALTIENDSMGNADFYKFLYDVYTNLYAAMADGASIYVFHADTEGSNFRQALVDAGLKLAQCCIWVKQSMVMGRQDYHWQHEPVLYGWKPTAAHNWYTDRKQTTVWSFDRPSRNAEHPTMKPVELIEYPINNSSKAGDVVLDVFGGSGSTLIACEKTGRTARIMELDPKYCDVIVNRWQDFTGKKAVREDGSKFGEVSKAA